MLALFRIWHSTGWISKAVTLWAVLADTSCFVFDRVYGLLKTWFNRVKRLEQGSMSDANTPGVPSEGMSRGKMLHRPSISPSADAKIWFTNFHAPCL